MKHIKAEQAITEGRQRAEGGRKKQDRQTQAVKATREFPCSHKTPPEIKHRKKTQTMTLLTQ